MGVVILLAILAISVAGLLLIPEIWLFRIGRACCIGILMAWLTLIFIKMPEKGTAFGAIVGVPMVFTCLIGVFTFAIDEGLKKAKAKKPKPA